MEALNTYHPHGFYTFTTNGYVNKEKENFLVGGSKLSGVFITVLVTLKQDMITFSIEEKISENKLVKVVEIPIKKDMELYPCFSASGRPTITFGAVWYNHKSKDNWCLWFGVVLVLVHLRCF